MIMNKSDRIPFQKMMTDLPVQVTKLSEFRTTEALKPHRHTFYMLLWTTNGFGQHRINYIDHELLPDSVFFMHEGQIHQMITYPEDGYVILFKQTVFQYFLQMSPSEEQSGLFDFFSRSPFVILDEKVGAVFGALVDLLGDTLAVDSFNQRLYLDISLLLSKASCLHEEYVPAHMSMESKLLRKLKMLINTHFRTEREAPFYAGLLGVPARKLNGLTKKHLGKLVSRLVQDRLLTECEALLGGTDMLIKEIIIELNFSDNAHFSYFFRKERRMTPSEFRRHLHGHP